MSKKFLDMLIESIESVESVEESKKEEKAPEKSKRGRPKKSAIDLKAIEQEFEAVKEDDKKLNKLIMKYGDQEDGAVAALVRKYMKYDKKKAEDYLTRDPDAEHSFVK